MDATKRPTVWFVGAGRLRLRIPLMKQLVDRGFDVGAVGPEEAPEFLEHGFPYHRYPLRRAFSPHGDWQAYRKLCQLFDEHRPDIVHAVNTKPALLVPYAARRTGLSSIRTITGLGAVYSSSSPLTLALRPVYKTLQSRASRVAGATVFQNSDDQEFFHRHEIVSEDRSELVLSSGIDVEDYRMQRSDFQIQERIRNELGLHGRRVITMVTRMIKSKGVVEYLKAARQVRMEDPDTVFLLIGSVVHEGPDAISAEELKQYRSDVRMLGSRTDIPDILALSDLFVLPSYFREGIPRVLLEAGAMGLPLITTDWPGCREVVNHGSNGLLIPPRDSESLGNAILHLLERPELRQSMGYESRQLVSERFHLNKVADQYEAIYRRVLGLDSEAGNQHSRAA
ncbi:MAG: glycosyl transferase family 1 [Planctomycetaceae bacterium]|nr:glycosyl transferase family 1 [Planctomycetaceae bacterium]